MRKCFSPYWETMPSHYAHKTKGKAAKSATRGGSAAKKPPSPMELARRLSANLHAVRETRPPAAHYGVHHGYTKS